jgi:hypothetical protein
MGRSLLKNAQAYNWKSHMSRFEHLNTSLRHNYEASCLILDFVSRDCMY